MLNLMRNAIEAMTVVGADRRSLIVRTFPAAAVNPSGSAIVVEVEDSGPGIDPDRMNSIFDAFFTTKENGTGLGLAICRSIVEDHGGELAASSHGKAGALLRIIILPIELADKSGSTAAGA